MSESSAEDIPVLLASGIHKSFPSGPDTVEVLRGIDCSVGAGTSLSVRGPSGGGKTTLLNILAGLEVPDVGQVMWSGKVLPQRGLSSLARLRGRHIGMVFQAYYLVSELSALENVLLASKIAGVSGKKERQRADDLLDLAGIGHRKHAYPSQLSGGERQRVAVARALINRPAAVLADEPTGNLDERTGEAVMEMLLRACREVGASFVLVTHNRAFAEMADQSFRMEEGLLLPLND